MRKVKLSESDIAYLQDIRILPNELQEFIDSNEKSSLTLKVSDSLAEDCRASFTHRLAVSGFDIDYELTSEGRQLEALIDKFGFRAT